MTIVHSILFSKTELVIVPKQTINAIRKLYCRLMQCSGAYK